MENPRLRPVNLKYVYRSACTQDGNEIPKAIPIVSGVQLSNGKDDNVIQPNGEKPEVANPR